MAPEIFVNEQSLCLHSCIFTQDNFLQGTKLKITAKLPWSRFPRHGCQGALRSSQIQQELLTAREMKAQG